MARADAERNRDRVLASASRLFAAGGAIVPMTAIAEDAGVGVGTVYRHFPTRIALIEAVYRSELDAVCDAAAELAAVHAPERALRLWLGRFVDYLGAKAGMSAELHRAIAAGAAPFAHSRARLDAALGSLLDGLRAAGRLRPDVTADDVLVLVNGVAIGLEASGGADQLERVLDLVVAAVVRDESGAVET